jgi:hypothetical protein
MTALCWLHYALDEMVQTGQYLHGYDLMEGTHMRIEVVDIVAVLFVVAAVLLVAAASLDNIVVVLSAVAASLAVLAAALFDVAYIMPYIKYSTFLWHAYCRC